MYESVVPLQNDKDKNVSQIRIEDNVKSFFYRLPIVSVFLNTTQVISQHHRAKFNQNRRIKVYAIFDFVLATLC